MFPPVSVVIPSYNRRDFLIKAVLSVLSQEYPEVDLVVVDDGSDDGTAEMLKQRFQDAVRYVYQENRGPAAARNRGIREARHDLIAFLDSDDRFAEKKLAVQAAAMMEQPDFLISHTEEIWFRDGRHFNQKKRHRKSGGNIFARSLELCVVSMSTVMLRREIFSRVGFFDEELPCCEDYDFWLRVSVGHEFLLIEQPLTMKDGGRADQVSFRHRIGMDRFRVRALEKLLAGGSLTPEQYRQAKDELIRKSLIYGKGCLKHGRISEGEEYLALARRYGWPGEM